MEFADFNVSPRHVLKYVKQNWSGWKNIYSLSLIENYGCALARLSS